MTPEEWATAVVEDNGADLLRYLARRAAGDEGELLNDTLVVIWERRAVLPLDPTEARMWAFGVARNMARRHHRRHAHHDRLLQALRRERNGGTERSDDPAHTVELDERDASVRNALRALREADRELMILVHWDGFTLNSAAALLGLNASTARTRYGRAKERLAARLSHYRPLAPRDAGDVPQMRPDVHPGGGGGRRAYARVMEHIELMPGVQKQDPTFGTLTLTLAEQPVGGETSWYWEAADGARIDCTGEEQAVLRGMTT